MRPSLCRLSNSPIAREAEEPMKRYIAMLALTILLPGCAQQIAENDDATCQSYGAQPGSSAYMNCRQHIADMRQQMVAQAIHNMRVQPAPVYYAPPPQMSMTTNCTTNRIGNTLYTNCN